MFIIESLIQTLYYYSRIEIQLFLNNKNITILAKYAITNKYNIFYFVEN